MTGSLENFNCNGYNNQNIWLCTCGNSNGWWLELCGVCHKPRYAWFPRFVVWEPGWDWSSGDNTNVATYYYPVGWKCPNCGAIHNPETKMCFCEKKKEAVNEYGEWEEVED